MRKFCSVFLIFALFKTASPKCLVNIVCENSNQTEFEIIFDEPSFYYLGEKFYRITMDNFGYRGCESGPELVGRVFNVAVPKGASIDILLEDVEWSNWQNITPAPSCSLTRNHNIIGDFDRQLYSKTCGGSASVVWDAIMRGVRIIGIDIIPVQYSPANGVRYVKKAKIVVNHTGGNEKVYDERLYHPEFAEIYRSMIVNYESTIPPEVRSSFDWDTLDGAELLVITRPDFADTIRKWADWKLFAGMPAKVVSTDVTGHDTASIRAYIRNAYDTWALPPAYVLLVGDGESTDLIPAFDEYPTPIYGDHGYTMVDGDDILQDIFLGRISADNIAQLRVMIQKHLNYEKNPDTTDNWYARAVGVVREDECTTPLGPGDSSYLAAVQYAMDCCASSGFTSTPVFRKCLGHTADDVRPHIRAGCNFVSFRGQGVADWWDPFSDLLTEPTGAKAPITVSITCGTGNFIADDNYPCEYATRCGTVSSPCGSIAWIGQTRISSNTQERSRLSYGIFKGWFEGKVRSLGAAHAFGKMEMLNFFGESYPAVFEYLTASLIGAGDMVAWTGPIANASVTFPPAVGTGEISIPITVYANGSPVKNARVAIHQCGRFSYGLTDSLGSVSIVKEVIPYPHYLVLVVTGQNIYPYVDTIYVSTSEVIIYNSPVIYNEVSGNGDALINPGETFSFAPSIVNYGTSTAEGLSGILRTSDTLITILDSTSEFPPVHQAESVFGDTVSFSIPSNHPAIDTLDLRLYVYGHPLGPWENRIIPTVAIHRFTPSLGAIAVLDPPPYGNGNGVPNAGEQIDLSIPIENNTYADVFSLVGTLECASENIAVVQPHGHYGDIPRQTSNTPIWNYVISVSPETPSSLIPLSLILSGDGGTYEFHDTLSVSITVQASSPHSSPWIYLHDSVLCTDSDGNGIVEPGDEVEMRLRLKNGGSMDAHDVFAKAVSTYFISASETQASFGDIPSGATAYNLDSPIRFSISPSCPSGLTLRVPISIAANEGEYADTISVNIDVSGTGISENTKANIDVGVFPNPFNNSTTIEINVPRSYNHMRLSIRDLNGKIAHKLFEGGVSAGKHLFRLNSSNLSSGLYFVVMETDDNASRCLKALLIK